VRKHADRIQTLRAYLDWLRPRISGGIDAATLREDSKRWAQDKGLKMPAFFWPLRVALTGHGSGPDIFDVMTWLGAPRVLRRIEVAIERLA
jgi:glutamyl/glutaminyl-tRNA synthetase